MSNKKKEILFIVQYPENISPGQRFRIELYKSLLEENGFNITTQAFFNRSGYRIIHKTDYLFAKAIAVIRGYFIRLSIFFSISKFDFIFLQREAAPVGPPVFEWLYTKLFKKKLIYDFDDAIWLSQTPSKYWIVEMIKNKSKFKSICKWAHKVSAGNNYLGAYAKQYSSRVIYNPTCVDTENRHNIITCHEVEKVTIGWTGSFSTLMYLEQVVPVLKRLQEKYDFNVKIICNENPLFDLKNLTYVEWSEENEVVELVGCQIGLMPLEMNEWCEGKCGFKLIQYMALGIPAVSSPVGVNSSIVDEGINGFLCNTDQEWYEALETLLLNAELRKKMGLAGRQKIIADYSLQSNKNNFLRLFE